MRTEVFRDNGLWSWLSLLMHSSWGMLVSLQISVTKETMNTNKEGSVTLVFNPQSVISVGSGTVGRKNSVRGDEAVY